MVRYKKILGVIAISINSIFLLAGCESDQEKELRLKLKLKLEKKASAEKECVSSAGAFVFSKEAVRSNLHSPSTANFPFLDYTSVSLGDCKYKISSYVDSQNGFGATVRTNYSATMQFSKATGIWTPIKVVLEE